MDIIYIYCLYKQNIPFYIGKTKNIKDRISNHKKTFGSNIELIILDQCELGNWKFWERFYISLFISWGFKLENKNKGGGGLSYRTDEEKLRISQSHLKLNRKVSNEFKDKMSSVHKGHKYNLGRVQSIETCSKKSKSMLGHITSQETKNKMSIAQKGKIIPIETRLKISNSLKNKPKSQTHKENMSKNRINNDNIILANSKPILQFDLEGNFIKEWSSITKAKLWLGKGDISGCIHNHHKTSGGFIWRFK